MRLMTVMIVESEERRDKHSLKVSLVSDGLSSCEALWDGRQI